MATPWSATPGRLRARGGEAPRTSACTPRRLHARESRHDYRGPKHSSRSRHFNAPRAAEPRPSPVQHACPAGQAGPPAQVHTHVSGSMIPEQQAPSWQVENGGPHCASEMHFDGLPKHFPGGVNRGAASRPASSGGLPFSEQATTASASSAARTHRARVAFMVSSGRAGLPPRRGGDAWRSSDPSSLRANRPTPRRSGRGLGRRTGRRR
jgi:hypothetical protein